MSCGAYTTGEQRYISLSLSLSYFYHSIFFFLLISEINRKILLAHSFNIYFFNDFCQYSHQIFENLIMFPTFFLERFEKFYFFILTFANDFLMIFFFKQDIGLHSFSRKEIKNISAKMSHNVCVLNLRHRLRNPYQSI